MPSFKAFSDRALAHLADPLPAAKAHGSARPASPLREILGPGTGPLPAPNGAAQDATDSEMSSVGQEEVQARQQFLDAAFAEFLGATRTGVHNEDGEELYSDGTFRPAPVPPVRAPVTQHFNISSDADEGGAATPSGSRKRATEADSSERSISPRLRRSRPGDDSCPELTDSSVSANVTPRTPVRTIVR